MSRTTRARPHGYNPGEKLYEEAKANDGPGSHPGGWWSHLYPYDFRKNHRYHGRDIRSCHNPIGYPRAEGPNGYCTRDEIWGMDGKRNAKKLAARYRRIHGAAAILAGMED